MENFTVFLSFRKYIHNESLAQEPLVLKCLIVKIKRYSQFNGYYKSLHQLIYKSLFSTYYFAVCVIHREAQNC